MKDETKKDRRLRKKLEKKQRKFEKKLRSLEVKLRELSERQKGKPERVKAAALGAPKRKSKAAPETTRKATRLVVAKPKKTVRVVKPKTALRKTRKATALVSAAVAVPIQRAPSGDDHAKRDGDASGVT